MECSFGNNQETLRESCVTVTQEEWNSSTEKMSKTLTEKNVWQST